MPRANGFQPPYTLEQLGAWIGQPIILTCYALVAFGFLTSNPLILVSTLWSIFLTCGLACWIFCQTVDSSVRTTPRCGIPRKEHEAHWCAVCKKTVFGIDHHCVWLNTCIGTRNYLSFYCLVFFFAATYLWQIISMILLVTAWWTPELSARGANVFGSSDGLLAVALVNIVLALPVGTFYLLLFLFHTYLQVINSTTFAWKHARAETRRLAKKNAQPPPHPMKSGPKPHQSEPGGDVSVA